VSDHSVILLVEDGEDDVLLIRQAFAKSNLSNPIQVVWDGEEAIAYLSGTGQYSNRTEYPLPDLVLLDLNMPAMDGFDVLKWIRGQPGLKALRVVVLTSSDQIRDVNQAYSLGANSFLVKPLDFDDFIQVSKSLQHYWLRLDKTPLTLRPNAEPAHQVIR
jgi:CheY-like chemotaxis protein